MFLHAPVVIDVGGLEDEVRALSFAKLVAALKRCQVVPVGVANVPAELGPRAAEAGLGVLALGSSRPRREPTPTPVAEPAQDPEPTPAPTMVLRQPVRGGQVVYAQRGDVIVLSSVNPGAQIIADGNIHVYGPLRGRALAGASGHAEARIFCQSLGAELVSVAGEYLMADEIPDVLRGRPAQVFLKEDRCRVAPL
jgi:septum site-determining protein MinC